MFTLAEAKGNFFDRARIAKAVERARRKNLSRFGAFVRRRARSSIRRRRRSSRPGEPPSSHVGLLRQFILFAYDQDQDSVVIGPARLAKRGSVPEVLEYGGVSEIFRRRRARGGERVVERERVLIKARPYMRPALEAELSKAASVWQDTVK